MYTKKRVNGNACMIKKQLKTTFVYNKIYLCGGRCHMGKSWLDNVTKKDVDRFLLNFDWADGAYEIKIKETDTCPIIEIRFGNRKGASRILTLGEYGIVAKEGSAYTPVYPFVDLEKANIRRGLLWCELLNKVNEGYKIDGKTYVEMFKEKNKEAIKKFYEGESTYKMHNNLRRLREYNFNKVDYRKR